MRARAILIACALVFVCNFAILGREPDARCAGPRGRMTDKAKTLSDRLARATDGLVYQSETDAPVEPFTPTGFDGADITPETLLRVLGRDPATPVEAVPFDEFFADLTAEQDWYGDEERATTRRYRRLVRLLRHALSDLAVYKVGERTVDIYVLGRTKSGEVAGVATKAVET